MADYTYQELMRMQNDAVKRVEDMQRRARVAAGIDNGGDKEKELTRADKSEPHHIPQPEGYLRRSDVIETENVPESFADKVKIRFGTFDIDEDKALILSLLLLLSQEKADETLMTALLYMLT